MKANIASEQAFNNLIEEIRNAPNPFIGQVYQIVFPEEMSAENHFDLMVSMIEEEF